MRWILFSVVVASLWLTACQAVPHGKGVVRPGAGRLMHSVAFWFKVSAPLSTADDLIATYLELIDEVDGVDSLFVGKPRHTQVRDVVDDSYDVFASTIFRDAAAEAAWQTHPAHLRMIERFEPLFDRVIVYDTLD